MNWPQDVKYQIWYDDGSGPEYEVRYSFPKENEEAHVTIETVDQTLVQHIKFQSSPRTWCLGVQQSLKSPDWITG